MELNFALFIACVFTAGMLVGQLINIAAILLLNKRKKSP